MLILPKYKDKPAPYGRCPNCGYPYKGKQSKPCTRAGTKVPGRMDNGACPPMNTYGEG